MLKLLSYGDKHKLSKDGKMNNKQYGEAHIARLASLSSLCTRTKYLRQGNI